MSCRTLVASGLMSSMVLCMSGCQGSGKDGIVQIGSTKAALLGPPKEFRALHPRLEKLFDDRVVFRAQPGGEALAQQLEQGHIAYAILSAGEYCAVPNPNKLTLLAVGLNALGKPYRKAYIVVRADSHVKEITDCKGKRFAFGTYKDLLTDMAAQAALESAGVPVKDLLPDFLTPPPLALEGRLYMGHDAGKTVVFDPLVNAGVVDEVAYEQMRDVDGSLILGPSKDQLKIVGETVPVPELVVVAGSAADPVKTRKLKAYLLNQLKDDKLVCEQLEVSGFAEPDEEAYRQVCTLLADKS